jgi:hypothetical protein
MTLNNRAETRTCHRSNEGQQTCYATGFKSKERLIENVLCYNGD